MNILIYTSSVSQFFIDDLIHIEKILQLSRGRGDIEWYIDSLKRPTRPLLMRDNDGDIRIVWDWFDETFGQDGYDVVCYHFTDYWKNKWGISKRINGSFNRYNTEQMQFWVCADRNEDARYYDFSEFQRIFLHEMGHADARRLLIPNVIHYWDYELHDLSGYFKKVDYRMYNLMKRLIELLKKLYARLTSLQTSTK